MPSYLLLLDEAPAQWTDVTPEEMQRILERYRAWSNRLGAEGRILGGHKLRDEGGRVVARGGGGEPAVTDGPYADAREVVGGIFMIAADDYDHAARLVADCPHLDFGTIRIREIEPMGE